MPLVSTCEAGSSTASVGSGGLVLGGSTPVGYGGILVGSAGSTAPGGGAGDVADVGASPAVPVLAAWPQAASASSSAAPAMTRGGLMVVGRYPAATRLHQAVRCSARS